MNNYYKKYDITILRNTYNTFFYITILGIHLLYLTKIFTSAVHYWQSISRNIRARSHYRRLVLGVITWPVLDWVSDDVVAGVPVACSGSLGGLGAARHAVIVGGRAVHDLRTNEYLFNNNEFCWDINQILKSFIVLFFFFFVRISSSTFISWR